MVFKTWRRGIDTQTSGRRSVVDGVLWEHEVVSSNLATPTI